MAFVTSFHYNENVEHNKMNMEPHSVSVGLYVSHGITRVVCVTDDDQTIGQPPFFTDIKITFAIATQNKNFICTSCK